MPLDIGFEPGSLDPKTASALDDIIAAIQAWANEVDGVNAAERLSQLTDGVARLPSVPTGVPFAWFLSTAPKGYLLCDGAAVSRVTYAGLFALFGTTFGAGDGVTTFNLPDLRGKYLMGKTVSGTGSTLNGTFGSVDHVHTGPSHTHGAGSYATPAHDHGGATGISPDEVERQPGAGAPYDDNDFDHTHPISSQGAMAISGTSGAAGTGNTGSANPPTHVINWIVKT